MFGDAVNRQIRRAALLAHPLEMCGLVAGGAFHSCRNAHADPAGHFRVDPADYARIEGEHGAIQAVVHSHVRNMYPSLQDQETQMMMQIPWGLTCVRNGWAYEPVWFGDQAPMQPLWGRRFVYGVWDCYAIVRDWHLLERNIVLPRCPREYGWWVGREGEKARDLYTEQFEIIGFREVDHPEQPGDVLIMKVGLRAEVPNHLAVYLGNEEIGHQLQPFRLSDAKVSNREPVHRWIPYTDKVVRHKDLFDA